jgi:hypothetical protein
MPVRGLGLGPLGSMPLGGGISTVLAETQRADPRIYRRLWVKRRSATTGQFETNWQNVSEYVEDWGSMNQSLDDSKLFSIRHSGIGVRVRNTEGVFNHHSNLSSLWFGYMTRVRSLVRVDAGYVDDEGNILPGTPIQGVFVLNDEVANSAQDDAVVLQCASLQSIFGDVKAKEIPGLNATMTADQFIAKIRDHTDGAGVAIFQQYISAAAWTIQSGTNHYIFPTDTALDEKSLWDVMEQVAESENKVCLINRTGGLEFRSRAARTTTVAWAFYGQGYRDQNVVVLDEEKEAIHKTYGTFSLKYIDADTTTSFVSAGTTTAVSATNVPWQVGNRVYDTENFFVANTTSAQAIVDTLQAAFAQVKREYIVKAIFAAELELLDLTTLSYKSYSLENSPLWEVVYWDDFNWATDGENFNLIGKEAVVISKSLNLNNFIQTVRLREA